MSTTRFEEAPLLEDADVAAEIPPVWSPCSVIRPNMARQGEAGIELTNALGRKRLAMSRRAVLALLSEETHGPGAANEPLVRQLQALGFLDAEAVDEQTAAGMEQWHHRNWTHSLPYYLWSRQREVFDTGAAYTERQDEALSAYLEAEGPAPEPPAVADAEAYVLAPPAAMPDEAFGTTLLRRVTAQRLPEHQLGQAKLSAALWYGLQSIRQFHRPDFVNNPRECLRSAGSAADIYLAVFDVEGLPAGIYRYDVTAHTLGLVRQGEYRDIVYRSIWRQPSMITAACSIILVAEFARYQWRYRHERALRNLYFDFGNLAQRVILAATSLRMRMHVTPAINDSEILGLLKLDPRHYQAMYSLPAA